MAGKSKTAKTRTRTRKLEIGKAVTSSVTTEMQALARTVFIENKELNAHKGSHDKARKELFKVMQDGKVNSFRLETTDAANQKVVLSVAVDTPKVDYIDVAKLKDLVGEETFMKIISATKSAVEEHAGGQIAIQSTTTKDGTTNVFVKAA